MTRTRGLVTGPSFTSDVSLPDALFVCLLGSPHPRARLVSLDDSRARSLPGVVAVLSAASAPEVFETELRFRGDRVAACAAESVDSARRAIEALAPTYEILPPLGSQTPTSAPRSSWNPRASRQRSPRRTTSWK